MEAGGKQDTYVKAYRSIVLDTSIDIAERGILIGIVALADFSTLDLITSWRNLCFQITGTGDRGTFKRRVLNLSSKGLIEIEKIEGKLRINVRNYFSKSGLNPDNRTNVIVGKQATTGLNPDNRYVGKQATTGLNPDNQWTESRHSTDPAAPRISTSIPPKKKEEELRKEGEKETPPPPILSDHEKALEDEIRELEAVIDFNYRKIEFAKPLSAKPDFLVKNPDFLQRISGYKQEILDTEAKIAAIRAERHRPALELVK